MTHEPKRTIPLATSKLDEHDQKFDVTSRLVEDLRSAWITNDTAVAARKIKVIEQALQKSWRPCGRDTQHKHAAHCDADQNRRRGKAHSVVHHDKLEQR